MTVCIALAASLPPCAIVLDAANVAVPPPARILPCPTAASATEGALAPAVTARTAFAASVAAFAARGRIGHVDSVYVTAKWRRALRRVMNAEKATGGRELDQHPRVAPRTALSPMPGGFGRPLSRGGLSTRAAGGGGEKGSGRGNGLASAEERLVGTLARRAALMGPPPPEAIAPNDA